MVRIIYLTSDLLFSSRVASIAREKGLNLIVAGSVEKLRDLLETDPTAAVIVDLEHRDARPAEIMPLTTALASRPTVIGYGSHVKEPLLAAARDAGFDLVLSRGQFDQQVNRLLQSAADKS